MPDVQVAGRPGCDELRELRGEVHTEPKHGGRTRRPRPRRDPGDGPRGARPRQGARETPRQTGRSSSKTRGGARRPPGEEADREDAIEKRIDQRLGPRTSRGGKGRQDEWAERPHERSPRTHERSHKWTRPDERPDEWPGPHERIDERARSHERPHQRAGSDERAHERGGPDHWAHQRPRAHERLDERTGRVPLERIPAGGPAADDAKRRVEAITTPAWLLGAGSRALVLCPRLTRARPSNSD